MPKRRNRDCETCQADISHRRIDARYCGLDCHPSRSVEAQYRKTSGRWDKYYNRLRCQKDRQGLSLEYLLDLHDSQEGLCALSGMELTCVLQKGQKCLTNASIDRIVPGSPYLPGYIQLVCRQANIMKWTLTDDELLFWCKRISDHAEA